MLTKGSKGTTPIEQIGGPKPPKLPVLPPITKRERVPVKSPHKK